MEKLLVASLLLALLGAASSQLRNCLNNAYSCTSDCSQVQFCINGQLITVETCSTDTYCNSYNFTCIEDGLCVDPSIALQCPESMPGKFPDPYDCSKYYNCPNAVAETCPPNTFYDPYTEYCTNRVCYENPLPICKEFLQRGPHPENPNIYYVCLKSLDNRHLVPNLFKCDEGKIFVLESSSCVNLADTTSVVSTIETSSLSTATSTVGVSTTTVGVSTTTKYPCTEQGQFPDLTDATCRTYVVCTAALIPYPMKCAVNYYYEPNCKKCLYGTGCQSTVTCL